MARWMAIVALLLGVGLTAYESFNAPMRRDAPLTIQSLEGRTGGPTSPLFEGGNPIPTPRPSLAE